MDANVRPEPNPAGADSYFDQDGKLRRAAFNNFDEIALTGEPGPAESADATPAIAATPGEPSELANELAAILDVAGLFDDEPSSLSLRNEDTVEIGAPPSKPPRPARRESEELPGDVAAALGASSAFRMRLNEVEDLASELNRLAERLLAESDELEALPKPEGRSR